MKDKVKALLEAIGESCKMKKYACGDTDRSGNFHFGGSRSDIQLHHLLRTAEVRGKHFSIQTSGYFIYTFPDGWERLKRGEDDCECGVFDLSKSLEEQDENTLIAIANIIL